MKKLKILKSILKDTNSDRILLGYIAFILADALFILIAEPNINSYSDALWYCYEVISTTGFGELYAATVIGRACSVILTIYSLLIIAIITGVVTNFYIQLTQLRQKDTLIHFMDKLEQLSDMNKEELEQLSDEVRDFRKNKNL